jgi:hypothetical protein
MPYRDKILLQGLQATEKYFHDLGVYMKSFHDFKRPGRHRAIKKH